MTEGSGGKKLPQPPTTGVRRIVTPPPTPAQRLRESGSFPQQMPAAEAPVLSPREQLLKKAGQFLSPFRPVHLVTDSAGRVLLEGGVIGEYRPHEKRILIQYDAVRDLVEGRVSISPFLASKMKIFFEVTESSVGAYAGLEVGQKTLTFQM